MVSVVLLNPLVKFSNSSWEEQVSRAPSVLTVPHAHLYFVQYQYCLGQYLLVCALSPVALQIKQVYDLRTGHVILPLYGFSNRCSPLQKAHTAESIFWCTLRGRGSNVEFKAGTVGLFGSDWQG